MGLGVVYQVRLSPDASEQAKAARAYYRKINPELAKRFQNELKEKLKGLVYFNAFAIKFKDNRRLNLDTFPYCIYFVVFESEARVEVVAIYHQSQQAAELGPE